MLLLPWALFITTDQYKRPFFITGFECVCKQGIVRLEGGG